MARNKVYFIQLLPLSDKNAGMFALKKLVGLKSRTISLSGTLQSALVRLNLNLDYDEIDRLNNVLTLRDERNSPMYKLYVQRCDKDIKTAIIKISSKYPTSWVKGIGEVTVNIDTNDIIYSEEKEKN